MTRRSCLLALATVLLLSTVALPQDISPYSYQIRRAEAPPPDASPEQLEIRGDELRAQKAFADCIDYYAAAVRKKPSAALYNKIGIAELQLEHFPAAQKAFQRAIKTDRQFPEAYNNLAVTYYEQKDAKKAIKQYLKALKLDEQNASFHANLGTAYLARKEFDKMSAEYVRAVQLDPEIFERTSAVGVSLQLGTPRERARYNYTLAKVYANVGNADSSLRYLKKALEEGFEPVESVYKDTEFAQLRKDPRFTALMQSRPVSIPQH